MRALVVAAASAGPRVRPAAAETAVLAVTAAREPAVSAWASPALTAAKAAKAGPAATPAPAASTGPAAPAGQAGPVVTAPRRP
ncbi:Uncharacterised protein [Mycobacterium tuberculosis]|nr:Uncharacterised protein [Mycobacterium tuberculosis]